MALGCAALVAIVVVSSWNRRDESWMPQLPPGALEPAFDATVPPIVADPRVAPGFDEAYDLVCQQTIAGLDAMYAAAQVGAPDLIATIDAQRQALDQRIAVIYERPELWDAADPLVLEYAESIAGHLGFILDGTEIGFGDLDGDVTLFRSLCTDWATPT